jgi:hypothetical protein
MTALKTIDPNASSFTANGKTYFIESGLSIERYRKFEEIEIELGFSRSFVDVFDAVEKMMKDINKNNLGDAYVKGYNIMNGVAQFKQKRPHVFRYCALFINEENENRAVITEDMINKKIEDWQVEGLNYEPFFHIAMNSLNGFKESYNRLMESILKDQKTE